MKERREYILDEVSDMVGKLMFYDRKEDDNLPRGAIEAAIANGEITIDEIVNVIREGLVEAMQHA